MDSDKKLSNGPEYEMRKLIANAEPEVRGLAAQLAGKLDMLG